MSFSSPAPQSESYSAQSRADEKWGTGPHLPERVAGNSRSPQNAGMTDLNREEVKARLEASEARVATAVEGIRGELGTMRAEFGAMRAEAAANAKVSQARADEFYAEAKSVLAEIRLANEQQKVAIYGVGYKVITWTLGTILAVGGLALGAWRAFSTMAGSLP